MSELEKCFGYYDRHTAYDMDYRQYMEKQAMVKDIGTAIQKSTNQQIIGMAVVGSNITHRIDESMYRMQTGIQTSIEAQTYTIVASQAALARTFEQGFDKINNTLDMGFAGISDQLGTMTASFSLGLAGVERSIEKMTKEICDRLDMIHDIVKNPLLTQSRELYRRAIANYNKEFFEESLEDVKSAVEKNKTDYISWFLMGKNYLFGVSEFSNIIDLDKAVEALTTAAKYIKPDITESGDAKKIASEIWFHLGLAKYAKSNELIVKNKKEEAISFLQNAQRAFEYSYNYSDKMLEALYNTARCHFLLGDDSKALDIITNLIPLDRNYCIKATTEPEFEPYYKNIYQIIEKFRKGAFIRAKNNYGRIDEILNKINAAKGTLPADQLDFLTTNLPDDFTPGMPYFDILDYDEVFTEAIPKLEETLSNVLWENREYAAEKEYADSFIDGVKADIAKYKGYMADKKTLRKVNRNYIYEQEKKYYMDSPIGGVWIPKKDVASTCYGNWVTLDPIYDLSLPNILKLTNNEFYNFINNLYEDHVYNDGTRNKVDLAPGLIKKFEILRERKEVARELIDTLHTMSAMKVKAGGE
jgi:tetratricopeptide (TPR) repeat protein